MPSPDLRCLAARISDTADTIVGINTQEGRDLLDAAAALEWGQEELDRLRQRVSDLRDFVAGGTDEEPTALELVTWANATLTQVIATEEGEAPIDE